MVHRVFCSLVLTLLVAGCESPEQLVPEPVAHTPLELDPTQPVEIIGWWSSDTQLLHVKRNSGYIVYPGRNRYDEPAQRGQWWKQSYATIWFEPYTEFDVQPYRGRLIRQDDEIMLRMGDQPAMRRLEAPPIVMEDHLFGTWRGNAGVLALRNDQRYRFTPTADAVDEPVSIAGHAGAWSHENGQVVLTPDAPNLPTTRLGIVNNNAGRALEGMNSSFTKQTESQEN